MAYAVALFSLYTNEIQMTEVTTPTSRLAAIKAGVEAIQGVAAGESNFETATDPELARQLEAFGPAYECADAIELTATGFAIAHFSLYTRQLTMTSDATVANRIEAIKAGVESIQGLAAGESLFETATDADRARKIAAFGPAYECADALEIVI